MHQRIPWMTYSPMMKRSKVKEVRLFNIWNCVLVQVEFNSTVHFISLIVS